MSAPTAVALVPALGDTYFTGPDAIRQLQNCDSLGLRLWTVTRGTTPNATKM